jgi:hypothetical protein
LSTCCDNPSDSSSYDQAKREHPSECQRTLVSTWKPSLSHQRLIMFQYVNFPEQRGPRARAGASDQPRGPHGRPIGQGWGRFYPRASHAFRVLPNHAHYSSHRAHRVM